MTGRQKMIVNLEPHEVYQRISSEVEQSYWLDILNSIFVRKTFVGFLGITRSTIWVCQSTRSANQARLKVFVEANEAGSRIDYEIELPFLAGILGDSEADIPALQALLPRLFEDSRVVSDMNDNVR